MAHIFSILAAASAPLRAASAALRACCATLRAWSGALVDASRALVTGPRALPTAGTGISLSRAPSIEFMAAFVRGGWLATSWHLAALIVAVITIHCATVAAQPQPPVA